MRHFFRHAALLLWLPVFAIFAIPAPLAMAARPAIPQGAEAQKLKIYVVRKDFEPLYSCGAPDCPVIGQAERGERMAILETVGFFYRVRGLTSGKEGWVNTKKFTPMPKHARVTARALNLRSCPSLGCAVLLVLPKGQDLRVLEINGGWTKVLLEAPMFPTGVPGQEGWVYNRYIRYY